ncbi:cupin domain-containing protein [Saccharothrix stipae]
MFQRLRIEEPVLPAVREMFTHLGEPVQVLTPDSGRPLVVHHVMGQLTMIDRGTGYITVDGQAFPLTAGDLYVISPGTPHSFRSTGDELHLRHWHWPQHLLHTDREILLPHVEFGPEDDVPAGGAP